MIDAHVYPNTARIAVALEATWPDHARFLAQSFGARDAAMMASTERRAGAILGIVGGELDAYCADYRFLCEQLMEEEIFFRRHGRYRLSRFEDALAEVYSNREFMRRYMNFLLLSHVLWDNHARAMAHFEDNYLTRLPHGARHLEVGPGHGLLLHFAANAPAVTNVTGWDISQTSIDLASSCLTALGDAGKVNLVIQDLFDAPGDGPRFDSVALSEILEHLEDPVAALRAVASHLRPGGLLWINVPVNSPAPDHLYLLNTPEEAAELARAAGFDLVDEAFFPMTGQSLQRARKLKLTISAVVTARLPS